MDTNEIIMLVIYLVVYTIRVFYFYKECIEDAIFMREYSMEKYKRNSLLLSMFVSVIWPFELVGRLILKFVIWVLKSIDRLVILNIVRLFDKMIDK